MMRSTKLSVFLGLAVMAALIAGCGGGDAPKGPKTYPVTGTVTLKGQPVSGATVMFAPSAGKGTPAVGTTDASGKYTLRAGAQQGAVPGHYAVSITKFESKAGTAAAGSGSAEMPKDYDPNKPPVEEAAKNALPAKYENTANSGLTATVTEDAGKNTIDFKLE